MLVKILVNISEKNVGEYAHAADATPRAFRVVFFDAHDASRFHAVKKWCSDEKTVAFFGDIMVEYWTAENAREKMIRLDGERNLRFTGLGAFLGALQVGLHHGQLTGHFVVLPVGVLSHETRLGQLALQDGAPVLVGDAAALQHLAIAVHTCAETFSIKHTPKHTKTRHHFSHHSTCTRRQNHTTKNHDSRHPRRQKPHWSSPLPLFIPLHQKFFRKKNFFCVFSYKTLSHPQNPYHRRRKSDEKYQGTNTACHHEIFSFFFTFLILRFFSFIFYMKF